MSDSGYTGVLWIFFGIMSLRRAYLGEKPGTVITLSSPRNEMSKRERTFELLMGLMGFIIGGVSIWMGVRH